MNNLLIYYSIMNCLNCKKELIIVYYKCTESNYRLEDSNEKLIYIKGTHGFNIDYEEVNTQCKYMYCPECQIIIDYPNIYDSEINKFKTGDIIMNDYYNHLNHNVIHNFTNITCKYCSENLLQKGYFNHTEKEQTDEDKLLYCYPEGIKNLIHIYNEDTNNKIKDIELYLIEFIIPKTDIGKKIIYCPKCNYFITNNLKEIVIN
tara:strand:- start:393 stop:1004 length:612 start_codon:yes stop_codon:yes gene_type:complete